MTECLCLSHRVMYDPLITYEWMLLGNVSKTPVISHSNGNPPFPIGDTSSNGRFSIAMLVYQRVNPFYLIFVGHFGDRIPYHLWGDQPAMNGRYKLPIDA